MKVLCEFSPGGSSFVRTGWGRVFNAVGNFAFWVPQRKGILDAMAEFQPDLFIGTTYGVDRAVDKAIRRFNPRTILFASAWGPLTDSLDPTTYPIVRATDGEKRAIERLKKETGQPEFVFIHVTEKYLDATMGGWRSIGVEPVGILNACDLYAFLGAKYRPELACDVGYVGGKWGYKSRNIDPYLLPLCQPDSGLKVKIFGNTDWGVPQYLGPCSEEDNRDLTVSATVCPNVSEPHSTEIGFDMIERLFRVPGAGGFCVSDWVEEAREVFPEDALIMERSPQSFSEAIRHFANHPEERAPFIEKGRDLVRRYHTYHDRVAQMGRWLGLFDLHERALQDKARLLEAAR